MTNKSIYTEDTDHFHERTYTISVLSENKIGLLHAIAIIFTRRKLNIEQINVSDSEVKGIGRYTIVVRTTRHRAENIVKQIEKLVDVLAAFLYDDHHIHYRELAMYKILKSTFSANPEISEIIKNHDARYVPVEDDYEFVIFEKTGHKEDTVKLLHELESYGVSEFVRSGRIALSKSKRETTTLIKQLEESSFNLLEV